MFTFYYVSTVSLSFCFNLNVSEQCCCLFWHRLCRGCAVRLAGGSWQGVAPPSWGRRPNLQPFRCLEFQPRFRPTLSPQFYSYAVLLVQKINEHRNMNGKFNENQNAWALFTSLRSFLTVLIYCLLKVLVWLWLLFLMHIEIYIKDIYSEICPVLIFGYTFFSFLKV